VLLHTGAYLDNESFLFHDEFPGLIGAIIE
jgi:hypothetical protein